MRAPYNRTFTTNGIACTTATVIAATLGIRDIALITPSERDQIKRRAPAAGDVQRAAARASSRCRGWDLAGMLTVDAADVADLIADGDTRWLNRGAHDLRGVDEPAREGRMPPRRSPLRHAARAARRPGLLRLAACGGSSTCAAATGSRPRPRSTCPRCRNKAELIMVHGSPTSTLQITALNFSGEPISGSRALRAPARRRAADRHVHAARSSGRSTTCTPSASRSSPTRGDRSLTRATGRPPSILLSRDKHAVDLWRAAARSRRRGRPGLRAPRARPSTRPRTPRSTRSTSAPSTSTRRSLPRIDISFNPISHGVVQGTPMIDLAVADYAGPVERQVRTPVPHHARGGAPDDRAGRRRRAAVLRRRGRPAAGFHLGALQTGFQAVEAMRRQLAVELARVRHPHRDPAHQRDRRVAAARWRAARRSPRASTTSTLLGPRRDARRRRPRGRLRRLRSRQVDDRATINVSCGALCSTEHIKSRRPMSAAVAARDEWELPAEPASVTLARGR